MRKSTARLKWIRTKNSRAGIPLFFSFGNYSVSSIPTKSSYRYVSPSRITYTFSVVPTCSIYLFTMTSQYFSSSSDVQQILFVCSQAISVLPLPPNGSSTIQFATLEFFIGYAISGTGFIVGWSPFFFGLSNSQIVVCFLSEYHLCLPFFFQPNRTGSCCH